MPYSIEVGMDVHKMFSVFAAVNGSGEVMSCEKLSNDTGVFDQYFRRFGTRSVRVTLEATRGINWILDYLSSRHIAYTVSNPFLNRAIAHVHCKNDKYDAQTLADLSRANLIAPCYVPSKPIRDLRDLIAHRAKLVQITTKLKNKVHQVLAKYNYIQPYAELFGPKGVAWIRKHGFSEIHGRILEETLALIEVFRPRVLVLEKTIREKVHEHPYYRLLQTVPGIGPLNAAVIIARVEDIGRFRQVKQFIRYSGLSVTTRASADKLYLGRINKQSDKFLRTVMVDAAIAAVQKDPGLRQFYDYLGGLKGKGIARVAVARKLMRSVFFVLKKSKPYHYRRMQHSWSFGSR